MVDNRRKKSKSRLILVVVDDSKELRPALRYACRRAKRVDDTIALAFIIEPHGHFKFTSVGEVISDGDRQEAEELVQKYANKVYEISGKKPVVYIRQGEKVDEVINLIEENTKFSVLVLGASEDKEGPGILVSELTGKRSGRLKIPITVIPGALSDEQVDNLS